MPKINFRHGQEFMIATGADMNRVYRVQVTEYPGNSQPVIAINTDADKRIGVVDIIEDDHIEIYMLFMGQAVKFKIPNNEIQFCSR